MRALPVCFAALVALGQPACGPTTPRAGGGSGGKGTADGGVSDARPAGGADGAVDRGAPLLTGAGGTPGCPPGATTAGGRTGETTAVKDGGADGTGDASMGTGDAGTPATAGRTGTTTGGVGGGSVGAGGMNGPGAGGATGTAGASGGGNTGTGGRGGGASGSAGMNGSGGGDGGGAGDPGAGGTRATGGHAGGGGAATNDGGRAGAPAPTAGELVIVELMTNPTGTDTGREWLELVNRATHPVSLAGLHIADAANDAAVEYPPGGGEALAPGGRTVLVQSADATKNGGLVLAGTATGTATGTLTGGSFGTLVSLNNDADTISVCLGPCATGLVIDRVMWDGSLGAGYDGHALQIDDSGRRCPATQPFGDGGSFGTPGLPNGACP